MKSTSLLAILLVSSLFLTAQAAVDAGVKVGYDNSILLQQTPMDLELNKNVQQHLRSTIVNYNPNKLTIYSQNGIVTLKGTAASHAEADRIRSEVAQVPGVKNVNQIMQIENK